MIRYGYLLAASFFLSSCGTYRTGSGKYNTGVGKYKTPSDYSTGTDSTGTTSSKTSEADSQKIRKQLSNSPQYIPRGPFKLVWPVTEVHINRGFHPPDDLKHEGLDLGGNHGTVIMAAHEGLVTYVGNEFNGYGNMVVVEYSQEWATLYAHLDSFVAHEGQVVLPGDPLGAMGATGHATGVHLHFEVMHNHLPVDPIPYLTRPAKLATRKPALHRQKKHLPL